MPLPLKGADSATRCARPAVHNPHSALTHVVACISVVGIKSVPRTRAGTLACLLLLYLRCSLRRGSSAATGLFARRSSSASEAQKFGGTVDTRAGSAVISSRNALRCFERRPLYRGMFV